MSERDGIERAALIVKGMAGVARYREQIGSEDMEVEHGAAADALCEAYAAIRALPTEPSARDLCAGTMGEIVEDALVGAEEVTAEMVEAALHGIVPGGAEVWVWLPQKDAWTPHETAYDVMRCAIRAAMRAARLAGGRE